MIDTQAPADEQEQPEQDEPIRLDAIVPKPVAVAAFRIPTTREWVKFSDAYKFMEVRVWVDAPAKVMEGLQPQKGDETTEDMRLRVLETLGRIVLDHRFEDGTPWADEEGVLPKPQDPVFWDRAPQPIVNAIISYIRDRVTNHPTLRRSTPIGRR